MKMPGESMGRQFIAGEWYGEQTALLPSGARNIVGGIIHSVKLTRKVEWKMPLVEKRLCRLFIITDAKYMTGKPVFYRVIAANNNNPVFAKLTHKLVIEGDAGFIEIGTGFIEQYQAGF